MGLWESLKTAEETGKWPPEKILAWSIREMLYGEEILKLAKALLKGEGRSKAETVYTLIISSWNGSMVTDLAKLARETGISPSPTAIKNGLKDHLKNVGRRLQVSIDKDTLSEIESQFGVSLGQNFFDEIYSFYGMLGDHNRRYEGPLRTDYLAILRIAKDSGVIPNKNLINIIISRIKLEGVRVFDENQGYFGDWVLVKDSEILEKFLCLERGELMED